jgi:ArsR family transcriptional regulator, arsenate/arsenite/antimonite-responsive transcriptional repressor
MHRRAMKSPDPSPQILMACIGDASRFRLVRALLGGARCVTDLAGEVGLSQSCTTRHLQALERRRVVCGARDGKRVLYRLCHEQTTLGPLLAWALTPEGAVVAAPRGAPADRASARAVQAGRVRLGRPDPKRGRPTAAPEPARRSLVRSPAAPKAVAPRDATAEPPPDEQSVANDAPQPRAVRRSDIEDYLL